MALRQLSCTGLQRHLRHQRGWCPNNIACRRASWGLTLGLAQEIFGLFAILGVVIIDGTSRRVDWELPATWLWLGFSRRYSLLGAMTWQAYAQRRMAALGARGSSVKA